MSTITLYAISESGSLQADSTTYSVARAGSGTVDVQVDTAFPRVGQEINLSLDYVIWEGLFRFDLSTLSGTINTAVLGLASDEPDESVTDFNIKVVDYAYGSMAAGDFVAGASLDSTGTLRAHFASSAYAAYGVYNDFTNDAMPALLQANIGGTIDLLAYSDRHAAGNVPTGSEFLYFQGLGTANPPRLVVDYTPTAPATTGPAFIGGGFF